MTSVLEPRNTVIRKRKLERRFSDDDTPSKTPFFSRMDSFERSIFQRKKYAKIPFEKIQDLLDIVKSNFSAIPFLMGSKKPGQAGRPGFISDIEEKLRRRDYSDSNEVLADFCHVLRLSEKDGEDQVLPLTLDNEDHQRNILVTQQEKIMLASHLKKQLKSWTEIAFAEQAFAEVPVMPKIVKALKNKFPNLSSEKVGVSACEVAESKEEHVWKKVLRKMDQDNKNLKPDAKFQKFRLNPSDVEEVNVEHAVHGYIAGYQFHKMITEWSSGAFPVPVPLREVTNPSEAIAYVEYIKNPELEKQFSAQKEMFMRENKEVKETLLFHGTAVSCVDSILQSNFLVEHAPVQQAGRREVRAKKMMFGRGVYFSEMPAVSLMYGNGLILCKVLLGRCEELRPVSGGVEADMAATVDSRRVVAGRDSGVIHVVRRPTQILPYCVIHLKATSLSSKFISPSTHLSTSLTTLPSKESKQEGRVVRADPPSHLSLEEQVEGTLVAMTRPVEPLVTMTITLGESCSPVTSAPLIPSCTICLEGLVEEVVALPCSHHLHLSCARQAVAQGQEGPGCLRCPQCQALHGTRTGSQPRGGEMSWSTSSTSLPGHPEHGTIVVSYRMVEGVQGPEHPHPGRPYTSPGFPRLAYLPDSREGRRLLHLLTIAFRRRLVFTVGTSLSLGREDCVTWAGIHHKTAVEGPHGYPDPGYLARLEEELRERGVTLDQGTSEGSALASITSGQDSTV